MDSSGGITASLQGRYASALYELASENKAVSTVETDLDQLGQAISASSDLASLIRNPRLTRAGALAAMTGLGAHLKLSPLTQKFLGVLAHNRRLSALPQIVTAFAGIAAAARGELNATVTSAHPLSADRFPPSPRS